MDVKLISLNEVERLRIIGSVIWALLIGAAVAYVLSSMGSQPFNLSQSLTFSAIVFIGILAVDAALAVRNEQ